jgi:hypothetical protein
VASGRDSDTDSDKMTQKQRQEWYRDLNMRIHAYNQREKQRGLEPYPEWKKELIKKGKAYARRGQPEEYYGRECLRMPLTQGNIYTNVVQTIAVRLPRFLEVLGTKTKRYLIM